MKKTRALLVLTTVMLVSLFVFGALSPAFAASGNSKAFKPGDANLDGSVTIVDATRIQRHLADIELLSAEQQKAAMVENGEKLTIVDATLIQRYLADLIDAFPVEDLLTPTEPETEQSTEKPTAAPTPPPTEKEDVTKVKDVIDIYFSNNYNWSPVNAYVYNHATGASMAAWPGRAMSFHAANDLGERVYKLSVDTTKYDRVIFNDGSRQTTDTPVTKASSGFFINKRINGKYVLGVYPYGQNREGKVDTVSLEYSKGYSKKISVYTPVGYDPADKSKKYSVLYMTDGQNLFGTDPKCAENEWECDETVLSLMQNGGDGVIVVGIDNANNKRDNELTPNLGPVSAIAKTYGTYENGSGKAYADFVVNKVIPYVEKNYNVNSVRGVAGSSSGGIESFYIGMEHMDLFDYVGALSPAFVLFERNTWNSYLGTLDFSGNVPRVYLYNGNGDALEEELLKNASAMESWMKAKGYPAEKLLTVTDNDATHNELFWALYFPEMLSFGLDL